MGQGAQIQQMPPQQMAPARPTVCLDCDSPLPASASFCPRCAAIVPDPTKPAPAQRGQAWPQVQTVEQTSKGLKAQVALATLIILAGVACALGGCVTGTPKLYGLALVAIVAGVAWRISANISIWWYHK